MARVDTQVNIRMPAELVAGLKVAADKAGRSMSAEVVHRLESTFQSIEAEILKGRMDELNKLDAAREAAKAEQRAFLRKVESKDTDPGAKAFAETMLTDLHHRIIRLDRIHMELLSSISSLAGWDEADESAGDK